MTDPRDGPDFELDKRRDDRERHGADYLHDVPTHNDMPLSFSEKCNVAKVFGGISMLAIAFLGAALGVVYLIVQLVERLTT